MKTNFHIPLTRDGTLRIPQTMKTRIIRLMCIPLILAVFFTLTFTFTPPVNLHAAVLNLGKLTSATPSHEKLVSVKEGKDYEFMFKTGEDTESVSVQIMKPQSGSDVSLNYEITMQEDSSGSSDDDLEQQPGEPQPPAGSSSSALSNGDLGATSIGITTTRPYTPSSTYILKLTNVKCTGTGKIVVCVFSKDHNGKEADYNKWHRKLSLEISPSYSEMLQGTQKKLKIQSGGKNKKNVKWKSSNKKIAAVSSSGVVKAKSPGKVTITCVSKSNSTLKGECHISVVAKAKSIKLNRKKQAILTNESYTLKATVKPKSASGQEIVWKSSNPKVAKVNQNGEVTGVKKGTATITATVKYKKNAALKAACKITVKKGKANNSGDSSGSNSNGSNSGDTNTFPGVSIAIKYPTMMYREGAMVFYTLKTSGYSGKLALRFKTSNYIADKTITVKKNSTYELSTLVSLSGAGGSSLPGGIYLPPTQRTVTITIFASGKLIGTVSPTLPGTVRGISIPNDFCKEVS